MAQTNKTPQLASVTARDGVDTRNKENSAVPCEVRGGDNLSVEKITGLGGQTAALVFDGWLYSLNLPDYIVPPGAEVRGSEAWCAWENWKERMDPKPRNLDYMRGGFSGYDDTEDHKAVLRALAERVGPNSDLFVQLYREFYNDAVARLKSEIEKNRCIVKTCETEDEMKREMEYSRTAILRHIGFCQDALDDYNVEILLQKFAARKLARWYKRFPPPGVRVSDTGTWIADDDSVAHNDAIWREMHPRCQGCQEDQPNQQAHMGINGCLEPEAEEDYERCLTCGGNAFGSDYRNYCSRACL